MLSSKRASAEEKVAAFKVRHPAPPATGPPPTRSSAPRTLPARPHSPACQNALAWPPK